MLNLSQEGIDINNRFFEAIQMLVDEGRLAGLKTFSTKYGLNQGNLASLKTYKDKRSVKPEYLSFLVRDFGISAEWLLLGSGNIKSTEKKLKNK